MVQAIHFSHILDTNSIFYRDNINTVQEVLPERRDFLFLGTYPVELNQCENLGLKNQ